MEWRHFKGGRNFEKHKYASSYISNTSSLRHVANHNPCRSRSTRSTVKSTSFAHFDTRFAHQRLCTILLHKIESVEIMPWIQTPKSSIKRSHMMITYKIWIGYYVVSFNCVKKYFIYIDWLRFYIKKCKRRSIYFLYSPSNAVK